MSLFFNRPTYERMDIDIPTPAGVNSMPSSIYFDVDKRFTLEQVIRIRE
ncbi:MAG: hypothetical protein K0S61_312, partial [Anaerocolumna sp.]|nr:hypothetical protein [Anaerocolumna sp.]